MNVNKYKPHISVIPEDDANRQLVNGFLSHLGVTKQAAHVGTPTGGWKKVLEVFKCEYEPRLRNFQNAHVVLLIDFDEEVDRRLQFEASIPDELRSRVFVIGSFDEPETLRWQLKLPFEKIGLALAEECIGNKFELWKHEYLVHNDQELQRLIQTVKPILFQDN